MAECLETLIEAKPDWILNKQNLNDQIDEINALSSFYENTDYFEILQDPSIDQTHKFKIKFKIPINTKTKNLKIKVLLPAALKETEISKSDTNNSVLKISISDKEIYTMLNFDYLTPLNMDITLPDNYPSESKPLYNINSIWLDKNQVYLIMAKLDSIWNENLFMPILFSWFEWLKENLIEFLGNFQEPDLLVLNPFNELDNINLDNFIYEFDRHNCIEDIKIFNSSLQNCMICFEEKMGSEFIRLNNCKHHFCFVCLSSMCKMHVLEGTVELLKCPDKDCKEIVPINIMSQILNEIDFQRWERLLFQKTLDSMQDIIYCPKCFNPIIIDEIDTHAFCMSCKKDFCKLCKDNWHADACKSEINKINEKIQNMKFTLEDLLKMNDDDIRKNFKNSNYIFELIKKTEHSIQNQKVLELLKKYIKCPNCGVPIEKIAGCNKITCNCGCIFCYICGSKIKDYDHFQNSNCLLWKNEDENKNRIIERPIHEAQLAVQKVLNLMPEQRKNIMNCPTCGQQQLKLEKNNHIKCWLCKTNMCFYCKKKISEQIALHYKNKCHQHS